MLIFITEAWVCVYFVSLTSVNLKGGEDIKGISAISFQADNEQSSSRMDTQVKVSDLYTMHAPWAPLSGIILSVSDCWKSTAFWEQVLNNGISNQWNGNAALKSNSQGFWGLSSNHIIKKLYFQLTTDIMVPQNVHFHLDIHFLILSQGSIKILYWNIYNRLHIKTILADWWNI